MQLNYTKLPLKLDPLFFYQNFDLTDSENSVYWGNLYNFEANILINFQTFSTLINI